MKILHIAPLIEAIGEAPPGGAEQGVVNLARIQSQDHEVSVVAARGSVMPDAVQLIDLPIKPGELFPVPIGVDLVSRSLQETVLKREVEVFSHLRRYLKENRETFDIVHAHAYDVGALTLCSALDIPTVHTLHLPPIVPWINDWLSLGCFGKLQRLVVCSKRSQQLYREATGRQFPLIYYGIDVEEVPYGEEAEDFVLFAGRLSPEKGFEAAYASVVQQLEKRLIVVGRVYNEDFFERTVKPKLEHPLVDYRGALPRAELLTLMSKAEAFVFPIQWDEPFGLVVVEAMAAGTPVVSFNRGASAELIRNGETGFVVATLAEMSSAVTTARTLKRSACRVHVSENYSLEAMNRSYVALYSELTASSR